MNGPKPPRRPGGPRLIAPGQASIQVTVRLTSAAYDAVYHRSRLGRVSVPTVARRALAKYLNEDEDQ